MTMPIRDPDWPFADAHRARVLRITARLNDLRNRDIPKDAILVIGSVDPLDAIPPFLRPRSDEAERQ